MTDRAAKKRRRREDREARERLSEAAQRRRRRLRVIGISLAGTTGLVVFGALASVGGRGGSLPAGSERAFGQHYVGLEARRRAAVVSTMGAPSAPKVHAHPHLAVWANGRRVRVPSGIGIDPRQNPRGMASLHTHEDTGKIHVEGQADATLGQLFAIWGVPFSREQLGPHHTRSGRVVQLWVDRRPSDAYGALRLFDGQKVVVAFGKARTDPP